MNTKMIVAVVIALAIGGVLGYQANKQGWLS